MNSESFDPGPLAEVHGAADGEGWSLTFVRDLRHPPEAVWSALTDPAQLNQWAPYVADRDLGGPGEVTLKMIDGDESVDLAATIRRAESPRLLEYTWGMDLLRWELEPTAQGTRLTLHHRVQDANWAPKVAAGWHLCLVVAERMLDGTPIAPIRGQDAMNFGWQTLFEQYANELGMEASG